MLEKIKITLSAVSSVRAGLVRVVLPPLVAGPGGDAGTSLLLLLVLPASLGLLQHLLALGLGPHRRVSHRGQLRHGPPHVRELRGGVPGVGVPSPDVLLHLPVAQAVRGASLVVVGGHGLLLHLHDELLQVVSLAPHLRVGGGQPAAAVLLAGQAEE